MPDISVLMSVYNGERFLKQAIESILAQSFSNFEFIIINDGSTDQSGEMIKSYEEKDRRIVFIDQDNQGLIAALNTGIDVANADLIARMDADDIAHPERLAKQYAYMQEHQNTLALGSAVNVIDDQGIEKLHVTYPVKEDVKHYLINQGSPLAHPATMFRKVAVQSLGGYRKAYKHAEDYDLWLRLSKQGDIDNLNEPLLQYREHDQKISVQNAYQQALVSVVARHAAQQDIDPTDELEQIAIDTLKLFDTDPVKMQWEIVDIMASGLLMSATKSNISSVMQYMPRTFSAPSKTPATRALLKFSIAHYKCKSWLKALSYAVCAFFVSPAATIHLVSSKL
ncbi:MAG: glycosyltransferase family 2 protein [Alphaproteobacteria bacterium]